MWEENSTPASVILEKTARDSEAGVTGLEVSSALPGRWFCGRGEPVLRTPSAIMAPREKA